MAADQGLIQTGRRLSQSTDVLGGLGEAFQQGREDEQNARLKELQIEQQGLLNEAQAAENAAYKKRIKDEADDLQDLWMAIPKIDRQKFQREFDADAATTEQSATDTGDFINDDDVSDPEKRRAIELWNLRNGLQPIEDAWSEKFENSKNDYPVGSDEWVLYHSMNNSGGSSRVEYDKENNKMYKVYRYFDPVTGEAHEVERDIEDLTSENGLTRIKKRETMLDAVAGGQSEIGFLAQLENEEYANQMRISAEDIIRNSGGEVTDPTPGTPLTNQDMAAIFKGIKNSHPDLGTIEQLLDITQKEENIKKTKSETQKNVATAEQTKALTPLKAAAQEALATQRLSKIGKDESAKIQSRYTEVIGEYHKTGDPKAFEKLSGITKEFTDFKFYDDEEAWGYFTSKGDFISVGGSEDAPPSLEQLQNVLSQGQEVLLDDFDMRGYITGG